MASCNDEQRREVQVRVSSPHSSVYSGSQKVQLKVFVQVVLSDGSRSVVVV